MHQRSLMRTCQSLQLCWLFIGPSGIYTIEIQPLTEVRDRMMDQNVEETSGLIPGLGAQLVICLSSEEPVSRHPQDC
ncbi:unnamed protein product [Pleuronectes platessa]|uniref:Uncharacterized protein n=1 Tax=Pleuronectes platessa TaxID=8262 RepID=A0A9N7ZBB1_PLEPL|nr:unnamed protein product [Pleuronectes platessa]